MEERIEWYAAGPYDESLELTMASQWTLAIAAGVYELPDAQPLPEDPWSAERSDVQLAVELRDRAGEVRFDEAEFDTALIEGANVDLAADPAADVVSARAYVDSPPEGVVNHWMLWLAVGAPAGADFSVDAQFLAIMACSGDIRAGPCPNRRFIARDPGGPTFRTRVVLDRGEVVLDRRNVPGDIDDGDFPDWAFMRAEVRIDGVEVIEDEHSALLYSPHVRRDEEGTYGVLPAGGLGAVGCGVVVDLTREGERAVVVDCELREVAPLAIAAIEREML